MPVQAKLIPYDPRFEGRTTPFPRAPGEFRFEDMNYHASPPPAPGQEGRFSFGCPRGTGHCGGIRIGNGFKPEGQKTWMWDGNVEKPTLTPSINCLSGKGHAPNPEEKYAGCGWHAHVTAGEFTGS